MNQNADPCAFCGGRLRSIEYRLGVGNIVSCPQCRLVSLVDPASGRLVTCSYDADYYHAGAHDAAVGYSDYFGAESAARDSFARCLAGGLVSEFRPARKALDIGCGGGYLVRALVDCEVDAYGIDMSHYAVTHGVAGTQGRLLVGETSVMAARAPFDLVTMMDVIEHLPDPVSAVRDAFSLLGAGGSLVILTPRYGGHLLARQGADYVHFNSDHMHYFTAQTFSAVIEKATRIAPTTEDVLDSLRRWRADIPADVQRKYTVERDSIVATVTRAG